MSGSEANVNRYEQFRDFCSQANSYLSYLQNLSIIDIGLIYVILILTSLAGGLKKQEEKYASENESSNGLSCH
jgi:hypothetical protein